MAHRPQVLSLYRQLFRLARRWQASSGLSQDTREEKNYIIEESRTLFRKNQHLSRDEDIQERIRECETRIELAHHYRIPYPRPVNIPQNTLAPTSSRLKKGQKRSIQQSRPIYLKSYDQPDS